MYNSKTFFYRIDTMITILFFYKCVPWPLGDVNRSGNPHTHWAQKLSLPFPSLGTPLTP